MDRRREGAKRAAGDFFEKSAAVGILEDRLTSDQAKNRPGNNLLGVDSQ